MHRSNQRTVEPDHIQDGSGHGTDRHCSRCTARNIRQCDPWLFKECRCWIPYRTGYSDPDRISRGSVFCNAGVFKDCNEDVAGQCSPWRVPDQKGEDQGPWQWSDGMAVRYGRSLCKEKRIAEQRAVCKDGNCYDAQHNGDHYMLKYLGYGS